MLIVLICVPLMLCVKPCYLNCTMVKTVVNEEDDEFVAVKKVDDEVTKGGDFATNEDDYRQIPTNSDIVNADDDPFNLRANIIDSYVDKNAHHGDDTFLEIMIH